MRIALAILLLALTAAGYAAIELGTIVSDDVLEPSIRNEVDHALSRAAKGASSEGDVRAREAGCPAVRLETRSFAVAVPPAWTNGLSATAIAIKLVSAQRADGRWLAGTNDVTRSAVEILRAL